MIILPEHIILCENIYKNKIIVKLPYPNTTRSVEFTKLVGSASYSSSSLPIRGCYKIIYGEDSYIGQSVRLGKRVREHASINITSSLKR
jgi:hypothetical protein